MLPASALDRIDSGKRTSTSERLTQIKSRWPCREQLVEQLAHRVVATGSSGAPTFVFGPPASGKTAIVRDVLRELEARHAYVNCQEATKPKPVLSSIITQLKGGKRKRDEGYECSVRCDSITDFLNMLPGVVGRRGSGSGRQQACWVVVDNCQRLAGTELLTALMKMRSSTGANVGLVMLSAVPWASGRFLRDTANVVEPSIVRVPGYRSEQLQKVLEHCRSQQLGYVPPDALGYKHFLQLLVPALSRASNNLLDLQAAASVLYPAYKRHQAELAREGRNPQPAQLWARIRHDVQVVVSQLELHHRGIQRSNQAGVERGMGLHPQGLAFELPYISKFLLMAAYIASRNKPAADRQVFDPGFRKRGRKDAQAADRAVEAALEARLRGPHAFPLERLLHIFFVLYPQFQEEEEGGGDGQGLKREAWEEMQQGEVLMQVSTLVSLRLLTQSSGDVVEGALYRCNLSEEMAEAVARNIKLRLSDYLKMG